MGLAFIIFNILLLSGLFILSKLLNPDIFNIWIYSSQISALLASLLFSISFVLSIRTKFIEKLFGGLDKVYKIHSVLGQIAFILVINHPIFLIINSLPLNQARTYLLPNLNNIPYFFGILSLYTLIILVSLTIFINLPYKLWRKTHEFMGLVIILGGLHLLLISSDTSRLFSLKLFILSWNIIAISAYFYKLIIYNFLKPKNNYFLSETLHEGNYLLMTLKPNNIEKFIYFKPGQFAFFSLPDETKNEHPFSILDEDGGVIKIGVRITGEFSLKLSNLKLGHLFNVNGPFGSFANDLSNKNQMIWISGGIGITPFLSMLKSLKPHQKVTMIHSSKSTDSNIFIKLIKYYSYYFPNFKFVHHLSDVSGKLNHETISKMIPLNFNTPVFTCGPHLLMKSLAIDLPKYGIIRRNIIYEDFKIK